MSPNEGSNAMPEVNADQLNEGDRVRVTRVDEGVVRKVGRDYVLLNVGGDHMVRTIQTKDRIGRTTTFERIEPAYVPDALYQDVNGWVWLYAPVNYSEFPWRKVNTNIRQPFDAPKRPLARLRYEREDNSVPDLGPPDF